MNAQEWQALEEKSRELSKDEYATEASNIIRLTKEEITSMIEEAGVEKEKLSELISTVDDASKSNNQKAEAIKVGTGLIEVIVPLIKRWLI